MLIISEPNLLIVYFYEEEFHWWTIGNEIYLS